MKRALLSILVVLILAIGVVVLAAGPLLNSAPVRERVVAALQRATGHAVRIGRLQLAPGSLATLAPAVSVDDVAVLNPPGFSRPDLLSARRVETAISLLPLLAGRVELRSITIEGADALLERDATGRGNWLPALAPATADPSASEPRPHRPIQLGPVHIENGRIAGLGLPPVELRSLTLAPSGGPVSGTIVVNGVELALAGDIDPAAPSITLTATDRAASSAEAERPSILHDIQLTGQILASDAGPTFKLSGHATFKALPATFHAETGPWHGPAAPLSLDLTADGGKLNAQGTWDRAAKSFEGQVSADIPDLARTGVLAGLTLPHLENATVTARLAPPPAGPGLLLRGLHLASTQGDLAGDLALTIAPRPALRGSLVAQQWNLDIWTSARPASPPDTQAAPPPSTNPSTESPWLIPDRPLPFEALRRADADLRLSIAQAIFRGASYRSIEARLLLQDGRLRLEPAQLISPAGPLQGQFSADATATPPTAALTLHGPGLNAASLNTDGLARTGILAGTMDVDLDLHAAGATYHAMAATLNGHLGFSLTDGEVENALLARLFGAALRGVNTPLDSAGHSQVRCIVLRTDSAAGQMHIATLALDTTRLRLEGDGTLDLANETMDMHLRPVLRLGGAAITVPVRLTGPFRSPRPAADKGVLAPGRFGISIAQLGAQLGAQLSGAPAPDPCNPR